MRSNISRAFVVAVVASAAGFGLDASAQTLYKLIDKNGKVTYSEKAPKDFDGKVIRMDIDPNANTATLSKPGDKAGRSDDGAPAAPASERNFKRSTAGEDRVAEARTTLERAQKAFADARDNPAEGEINWIGNKGGGARAQPTEEYQRRLEKLEQAVKDAEDALLKAEQNR